MLIIGSGERNHLEIAKKNIKELLAKAVDKMYQKMHYDSFSEKSPNPEDHYYFSDDINELVLNIKNSDYLSGFGKTLPNMQKSKNCA